MRHPVYFRASTIVTLSLFFCALPCNSGSSGVSSFLREWHFPSDVNLNFEAHIVHNDYTLLYSSCSSNFTESVHCKVTIEKLFSPSRTPSRKTCDLNFYAKKDHALFCNRLKLDRWSNDRVLVGTWGEIDENCLNSPWCSMENIKKSHAYKVTILNMNTCNATTLAFDFDYESRRWITNTMAYANNTFDVIVSSKRACRGQPQCRLSFDQEGQRIGEPQPFTVNELYAEVMPVSRASPEKGFFVLSLDSKGKLKTKHVSPANQVTQLWSPSDTWEYKEGWQYTSHAHDLLGVCQVFSSIRCVQFDTRANSKMHTEIEKRNEVVSMHNLADGGMLMLTRTCGNSTRSYPCDSTGVLVTKIYPGGRQGKTVEVTKLNFRCAWLNFFDQYKVELVEEVDKFCFYFACVHLDRDEENLLNYNIKCVPKKLVTGN